MSGDSKSQTQTSLNQNSKTDPWAPAQPLLQGILGQLQGQVGNTGVTQGQTDAINNYQGLAPQFNAITQSLLSGGGANNQAGGVQGAYDAYKAQTNPLASNTDYNPYNTPGFADAIRTATGDITNNINGQFAAAGRDFSGANSQALARGLTQGLAPTIANQYNQNIQNQQGAAQNLYSAGNTNAGILSGLQQQYLQNQGQGITNAGNVLQGGLSAGSAGLGTTANNLGLLANIGIPIAGLGNTSSGTSTGTSSTTYSPSIWQTLGQAGNSLSSLTGGLGSAFKFISDRNAKEDIAQVGVLFDGTPVYRFRYINDPRFQIGLMAQDIEQRIPEAVGQIGPWKAVDYKLATDKALEVA